MAGPPLTCWVGWPGPSSLLYPKKMRCATQRVTLSLLPLFWLCHYQSRVTPGPAAPDLIRTIILMTKQGPAYLLTSRAIVPRSRPATCWEQGHQSLPNLVKGLGDRGFSGTVSRLDFLNQIGLVGRFSCLDFLSFQPFCSPATVTEVGTLF